MENRTTYKAELYLKNEKKFCENVQKLIQEKGYGNVPLKEVLKFDFEWGVKNLPSDSN